MAYHHRLLFHNVIMEVKERMEQDRAKGYLVPGRGEIEIIGEVEELRIFTTSMQCVIVAIIQYRFTVADSSDMPLFVTADGDMT